MLRKILRTSGYRQRSGLWGMIEWTTLENDNGQCCLSDTGGVREWQRSRRGRRALPLRSQWEFPEETEISLVTSHLISQLCVISSVGSDPPNGFITEFRLDCRCFPGSHPQHCVLHRVAQASVGGTSISVIILQCVPSTLIPPHGFLKVEWWTTPGFTCLFHWCLFIAKYRKLPIGFEFGGPLFI